MAAEDILGISAQMDISDIQKAFDNIINNLNSLGVKTDEVSSKMSKALNSISQSAASDGEKTKQSIEVYKNGIAEINKALETTPEQIKKLGSEATTAEATLEKLEQRLSEATEGTPKWEAINEQIKNQQNLVSKLNGEYDSMLGTFGNTQQYVGSLNTAIEALNAGRSISTATTGASSVAHAGVATAVGAEAAAHVSNAKEINNESESVEKSVQSFKDYEEEINAVKQRISELQQKIIETKEDIQNAKNDVKDFEAQRETQAAKYGSKSSVVKNTDAAINMSQQEVDEQTRALQGLQIELQKSKLQLSDLRDEQKLQASATKGQSDEFSDIVAKIENWKSSLSDIDGMSQKFESQNQVISAVKQSIDELSASAANYSEEAKALKEDIDISSLNTRIDQRNGTGDPASDIDAIKQKISEYGEAVSYASGQANAAYELQKEAVAGLETQLSQLQEQLQAAQATNNTEAVEKISEQVGVLKDSLSEAKTKLAELKEQSEKASEELNKLSEVQAKLNENTEATGGIFGRLGDAFTALKNNIAESLEPLSGFTSKIGEAKDKVVDFATGGGKFQESLGNIKTAVKGLPIPIDSATKGVSEMVKSLWAMCSTPVGAVLAAITIGLQAVYKWFTKSAEGQRAFTKITAYFGSIMSSITDIVVIFGKYLYHAFADNKAPMNSFAKSFVKTFKTAISAAISLVSGLGTTLKGIFTLDWDTFTDGLSKTWDGLKKAGTAAIDAIGTAFKGAFGTVSLTYDMLTSDKLGKELGSALEGMLSKASNAAKIAEQELNTNIQLGKEKEKQEKLNIKIAENREKIYTLTGKAKDAMIEETKTLMKQKYDGQIKAQKELYEIQKKRNQMHTSSLEDIKKERDLHIALLSTQAQQMASTRMLTRMQESNRRSEENADKQKKKKAESDDKKEQNKGRQVSSAEGKLEDVQYKNAYERIKAEKELEDAVTEAKLKAMGDNEEKVIAQKKRELEKELDQIEEKKNALIKAERDRQKAEFEAQQAVNKAKGSKTEKWDEKKYLNNEPINNIVEQYKVIKEKTIEASNNEIQASELQSMREYLKEYGSLMQQKQAIAEDYDEKIRKAKTKGEKLQLEQQKKQALSNANFENISMGIDWKGLFSGVANISKEMLQPMLDQLEAYTQSSEFRSAGAENQQKVVELMQEIRSYIGTDQSVTWETLADAINKFNQSVVDYQKAVEEEKKSDSALQNAKDDLKNGKITQEDFEKIKAESDKASQAVVDAREKMNTFGVQLNSATDSVKNYSSKLDAALNKMGTWKGVDGFSGIQDASKNISSLKGALDSVLPQISDGVAKTIGTKMSAAMGSVTNTLGSGLSSLMSKGIGQIVGIVAQIPKIILQIADAIKNFVTGILDSFTELLQFNWLSDLVNSILDAVGNLIDAIFDLPENIFKALESILVKGVGGLLDTVIGRVGNVLSFGAFSSKGPSSWFKNSNAEKVQKIITKLTDSNERLNDSISSLEKTMSSTYGSDAQKAYEEAKRQQEKVNSQTLQIAKTQAGYHGAHGSWNHYLDSLRFGFTDDGKVYMSTARKEIEKEVLKATNNQKGDIWSLTPEEMNKLLGSENAVNLIKGVGKGGYGDRVLEKLKDYADLAGEIDDLTEQFQESITQISFDSMKDSFVSNLMDMEKSAEDFADDFADMMQKALLSYSMEDLINTDLKNLYNDWAKLIEDKKGKLTEDDIKELNKRYDAIVDEGLKRRDEWAKVTGYTGSASQSEQTAIGKGIEAITEDQASSLIGIGYAMQIALEQGNEVRKGISLDISLLRSYSETIGNNISEMRDIQYQGLEQLQAINKNTAPIILIREDIANMYKLMKDRY